MDTFVFKGVWGCFRPKDREYRVQSGDYVCRPDSKLFRVEMDDKIELIPIKRKDVPKGAVVVALVAVE